MCNNVPKLVVQPVNLLPLFPRAWGVHTDIHFLHSAMQNVTNPMRKVIEELLDFDEFEILIVGLAVTAVFHAEKMTELAESHVDTHLKQGEVLSQ